MIVDAARFQQGQTFAQFVDTAVQLKELWDNAVKRLEVPDEFGHTVAALPGQWHLLSLTEDWCLDAISSLTPIAKLTDQLTNLDLRVLSRDANLDIMDSHLTNGGRSIPIIILYDDTWTERAWWGPRPAELQTWVMTVGKTVESAEKYRHIRGWYARDKGQTVLREVTAMLVRVAGASVADTELPTSVHIIPTNSATPAVK
jgi:hypothetical protein